MSMHGVGMGRRHLVILLPLLLCSCHTQPASIAGQPKPATAEAAPSMPPPVPSKPAPVKEVMTRFSVALADQASNTDGARAAAASLSARIESCWQGPAAPDAPPVALRLALNQDGSVNTVTELEKKAFTSSPAYRASASTATAALFKCGPFVLPASDYPAWKSLDLRVTPHH